MEERNVLNELYAVILVRKANPKEGSYTNYLMTQGIDKILKKVGEESAETIIAAKNGSKEETIYETCDLLYHLSVLLEEMGITWTEVMDELARRELKTGNLKQLHTKGDI